MLCRYVHDAVEFYYGYLVNEVFSIVKKHLPD